MATKKPRLLVIGSRGFLGRYVARAAQTEFTVLEANRNGVPPAGGIAMDVRNESSVRTAFRVARPDLVMLLSAISDIDRCQQHPEEAREVNLRGAEHVARAAAQSDARLLFTSTGAVFDGLQHGYAEDSAVSPVSVYGETKAMAEKSVLSLCPSAIVVRLSLVLGFAGRPGTNALLDSLRRRWAAGEIVPVPVFESRNPIDAPTAAGFMVELLKLHAARGIFHVGSSESIARYQLCLKLADRMGYPDRVREQREPVPGRAPRGPDHFLLTDKLSKTSTIPIPTCDQVIQRCFDGLAEG
jgi:dTDP-4-dehydrorhamnose reductase